MSVASAADMPSISSGLGYDIPCAGCVTPREISARVVIAPASEPGERLVITGRVFQGNGVTPAPGITLWLSQSDVQGRYAFDEGGNRPRLHGWVRSGADGRYEIETIRPGPRPDRNGQPAKIYVHLYGPRLAERFIPEYRFLDDPQLAPAERDLAKLGRFSPIVALRRGADSVWRGTRDLRIELSQADMVQRIMALARNGTLDAGSAAAILKCRVGIAQRIHAHRRETPMHGCPGLENVVVMGGGKWVAVGFRIADWMELTLSDFDALVDGYPFTLRPDTGQQADGTRGVYRYSHMFRTPAGLLSLGVDPEDDVRGREPYERVTSITVSNEPPPGLEGSKSLKQLRASVQK